MATGCQISQIRRRGGDERREEAGSCEVSKVEGSERTWASRQTRAQVGVTGSRRSRRCLPLSQRVQLVIAKRKSAGPCSEQAEVQVPWEVPQLQRQRETGARREKQKGERSLGSPE